MSLPDFAYNSTVYSQGLKDWAELMLRILPPEVDILLSSSSSGCAIASAMIVLAGIKGRDLRNLYIRKESEVSHGGPHGELWWVEASSNPIAAFVDDFISTGDTFRRVFELAGHLVDLKYVLTATGPKRPSDSAKYETISEIAGRQLHWIVADNERGYARSVSHG